MPDARRHTRFSETSTYTTQHVAIEHLVFPGAYHWIGYSTMDFSLHWIVALTPQIVGHRYQLTQRRTAKAKTCPTGNSQTRVVQP